MMRESFSFQAIQVSFFLFFFGGRGGGGGGGRERGGEGEARHLKKININLLDAY